MLTNNWTRGKQPGNTQPPQSTTSGLHVVSSHQSPDGATRADIRLQQLVTCRLWLFELNCLLNSVHKFCQSNGSC